MKEALFIIYRVNNAEKCLEWENQFDLQKKA